MVSPDDIFEDWESLTPRDGEGKECEVPTPLESLRDLEVIIREDPEALLLDMRLTKILEAPSALTIMRAVCTHHGWKIVGEFDHLSKAAKIAEDLCGIEEVTIPLLEMAIQSEDTKAIHDAMQDLSEQVEVILNTSSEVCSSFMLKVDHLFCFVTEVSDNLANLDLPKIKSLLKAVTESSIRLDDGGPGSTLLSVVDAFAIDINHLAYNLILWSGSGTAILRCDWIKVKFHCRAIRNRAVQLNKMVQDETKIHEEEGGVNADIKKEEKVNELANIIRDNALILDERVSENDEREDDELEVPQVGECLFLNMDAIIADVCNGLKNLKLQIEIIRKNLVKY